MKTKEKLSNTVSYYKNQLKTNSTKIPVENYRDAYWEKNPNFENNWVLKEKKFKLGKNWLNDHNEIRLFGWVEEINIGENKGLIEATIPTISNEDDENLSDSELIGYYTSVASAMVEVVHKNHPVYGWWI